MKKAVIFDFAGVISVDGYWKWLRKNVPDLEQCAEQFHEISYRADRGDASGAEFTRFVAERAGVAPEEFFDGFMALMEVDPKLVSFIRRLKSRYKIGLISNFVFEWLDKLLRENDLHSLFDDLVISSQVKVIKPDPKIFELSIERLGVKREEAVFIDDRELNVDGAKRFGMDALLYKDPETLEAELKAKWAIQ